MPNNLKKTGGSGRKPKPNPIHEETYRRRRAIVKKKK